MRKMSEWIRDNEAMIVWVAGTIAVVAIVVVLWSMGVLVDSNDSSIANPSNPVGQLLRQVTRF